MDNLEHNNQPDIIELSTPVEATQNVVTKHDDFDWGRGKIGKTNYSEADTEKYLAQYDQTLSIMKEYEIVAGRIVAITASDIVLDLNYKSDGVVSRSEFRDTPGLQVGDFIDVYVENQEDKNGQLILSRRKAKLLLAWDNIVRSFEEGTVITGHIISKTKGGLIADVNGLETFLPGSQIDIKPIIDYDAYVGKTMEFKVVKINEQIKNAVVSHKALIESDLETQRQDIISKLEKGQVLEGMVKNITDFGAFLDLGGVDGLLYITDISWGRIKHPSDVLENGQKLNVVVLGFDDEKKRISLGLKQLQSHPWDVLAAGIQENSTVEGKIVNIADYGAFLEITPGVEGLIHVSEVSWSSQSVNSHDYFKEGDVHQAKVVTIDRENRKMSLSLKQLVKDPWSSIEEKYPIGSKHTGEVKNTQPYGVFVELEEGIGGMVHISDLSWTRRFTHPNEFVHVGDKLDITILEIDKEHRKLSLGHKQLEENPWDTFESIFPVGSNHEAILLRRDDRGAIVQLPYGLEAFAPIRQIKKEDGTLADIEERLMFKVIEFNRDDKRIVVSHTRYYGDLKKENEDKARNTEQTEANKARETVKKTNTERNTTFGEIEGFADIKEQLQKDGDDNKGE